MVPSLPPISDFELIISLDETYLECFDDVVFFDLDGRICNLGFSSVPEFSAAS